MMAILIGGAVGGDLVGGAWQMFLIEQSGWLRILWQTWFRQSLRTFSTMARMFLMNRTATTAKS